MRPICGENTLGIFESFARHLEGRRGIQGGFLYFSSCALDAEAPAIRRPEDAAAALEPTLAAAESVRTGEAVRVKS
jgi:hypothetical protein